jgi:hypothetical protein
MLNGISRLCRTAALCGGLIAVFGYQTPTSAYPTGKLWSRNEGRQGVEAVQYVPNGQSTLKLSNGRVYVGETLNGAPNGHGVMTYPDGQKYVGDFRDGQRYGPATVTFADGRKFVGEYRDDKRNGRGVLTLPDGEKYVGEYRDGEKNGQGTSYLASGEVQFTGWWVNGNFTPGPGSSSPSSTTADQASPASTLPLVAGQGRLPSCPGVPLDPSAWGSCQGSYTTLDGKQYVGVFRNGKLNGQGTYLWAGRTIYVGGFSDGKFSGYGNFTQGPGKYVGEFRDNAFNGHGIYTYPNGGKYIGEFRNGMFTGLGTEYLPDGSVRQAGMWSNDRFIEPAEVPIQREAQSNGTEARRSEAQTASNQAATHRDEGGISAIYGSWRLRDAEFTCRQDFMTFTADSAGVFIFTPEMAKSNTPPTHASHKSTYVVRDGVVFVITPNYLSAYRILPNGELQSYVLVKKDGMKYNSFRDPVPDISTVTVSTEEFGGRQVRCDENSTQKLSEIPGLERSMRAAAALLIARSRDFLKRNAGAQEIYESQWAFDMQDKCRYLGTDEADASKMYRDMSIGVGAYGRKWSSTIPEDLLGGLEEIAQDDAKAANCLSDEARIRFDRNWSWMKTGSSMR